MTDPFDDDDLEPASEVAVELPHVVAAPDFDAELERLEPYLDSLVAGFASGRVRLYDPAERLALTDLRIRLDAIIGSLTSARGLIDKVFLLALIDKGARAMPLPDGREVAYEPPRGEYVTHDKDLYDALTASGEVSPHTIGEAISVTTTYRANHARLNAMAKKLGDPVAGIIAAHRTYVTPGAERGRVRFPTGGGRP